MVQKTLLVIAPSRKNGIGDTLFHLLVAETGEHLASHICSHYGFAEGDLFYNRPESIEQWKKRFGEIEVKFIDDTNITEDELLRRNKEWFDAAQKNDTQNK